MRFFVYYILNEITSKRFFTRVDGTLLETLFNGFPNARKFCLKRNYNSCDRQTEPKIVFLVFQKKTYVLFKLEA